MDAEVIKSKIYLIRGARVILDKDIAVLYSVETKRLKEAVRRNIERFPEDFMFELSLEEYSTLRTQNASSKRGGDRYMPFAFTEQGVAMLSSVLRSKTAIDINIQIMRTFVHLRQLNPSLDSINKSLKLIENKYDKKFRDVFQAINYLLEKDKIQLEYNSRKKIGFKNS